MVELELEVIEVAVMVELVAWPGARSAFRRYKATLRHVFQVMKKQLARKLG